MVIYLLLLSLGLRCCAADSGPSDDSTDASGAAALSIPCTDEASCMALYSGTDCNPPAGDSAPLEGNSYSYDDLIAGGNVLEKIECISAYSETDDHCFNYDDMVESINDGDPCGINEVTSCDTAETCAAAFDSTECNPSLSGEPAATGNSWNYEQLLALGYTDEQAVCTAGYADADEFALGCITDDGAFSRDVADGDPCGLNVNTNCSTSEDCSDTFPGSSLGAWGTQYDVDDVDRFDQCATLSVAGNSLTWDLADDPVCTGHGSISITKTVTVNWSGGDVVVQMTIDSWSNLTTADGSSDAILLDFGGATAGDTTETISIGNAAGGGAATTCAFHFTTTETVPGGDPCNLGVTNHSTPVTLKFVLSGGNSLTGWYKIGDGIFTQLGSAQAFTAQALELKISAGSNAVGSTQFTVSNFEVTLP